MLLWKKNKLRNEGVCGASLPTKGKKEETNGRGGVSAQDNREFQSARDEEKTSDTEP